ncbi:MAG: DUF3095 family protein [Alphaproteobacteria bacterium]|nr:DUF3095 family protein [Alphaproteobacteria bacterium]MDD9919552.1 DUF3095 family protein [Alphaproteobacteria bacterium]
MSERFFSDMKGFANFEDACNEKHYHQAPEDWFVVLTDIQGSTKAIQAGRYKDVNMVGAACIAAVVNTCDAIKVPYVFGGDGATFLVPPTTIKSVSRKLLAVQRLAQNMHGLALRVGVIPMKEIIRGGKQFKVAKYIMPTGCSLAMFLGGGASFADELLKQGGFDINEEEKESSADLSGLSCRWQPIKARHPVGQKKLTYKWPTIEALRQSQMVWRQGSSLKNAISHVCMIFLFNTLNRFNLNLGDFNITKYKQEMIINSDYRKLDDMLRMVVDCTKEQAKNIESYLAKIHTKGTIVYGTHYSDTALMTCFVKSTKEDDHIHFIDGSDGGYALAAKQLKQQLSEKYKKTLNIQP